MARTIDEIKQEIGKSYINNIDVRNIYNIPPQYSMRTFDAVFSKVSIESLLFYTVAFTVWTFENMLDLFRTEIQTKIDGAVVANKAWWHAQALKFQRGHNLTLNPLTYAWEYATPDTTSQVVKRVAVRESLVNETGVTKVKLLVVGSNNGIDAPLSAADLNLFRIYTGAIKPAGVVVECISDVANACSISVTVGYNPLLIDSTGKLINSNVHPAEDAINTFIKTLNETTFGGKLYLTKLTDAIQAAEGVVDVRIDGFVLGGVTYTYGNFESTTGWFALSIANITYSAQVE